MGDAQRYKRDSQRMFGRYIHHPSSVEDSTHNTVTDEDGSILADQAEMFKRYVQVFGHTPPAIVWPHGHQDCTSCADCNIVGCGQFLRNISKLRSHVYLETFAGYVPIRRHL